MNRDDILQMAREAWKQTGENWVVPHWFDERAASFEYFASLVAAHERNRCCKIVYGMAGSDNVAQRTVDAIRSKDFIAFDREQVEFETRMSIIEVLLDLHAKANGSHNYYLHAVRQIEK